MEQIQELFEILKETPQMALWGLTIYVLFVLAKLASWIYALKSVLTLFINRYFTMRDKEYEASELKAMMSKFDKESMSNVSRSDLFRLLDSIKVNTDYIHLSDLNNAINKLKEHRNK